MMNKDFNVAPLSGGYMITSIVGFLVSIYLVEPTLAKHFGPTSAAPKTWAFTLVLFFVLMFVASLISMTYAPTDWQVKTKGVKSK